MTIINSLTDADGDLFLGTDSADLNKLLNHGWSYAASLFDSYRSPDAQPVYRLSNKELDSIYYTASKDDVRSRVSGGWVNEGVAFRAAVAPTEGLSAIHQLYRQSDHTYLYAYDDALIGEMTQNGFSDEGTAWYSPVNTGTFEIKNHSFDPITGRVKVSYSLDELQLSQFRDYANKITFRASCEDSSGRIRTADLGTARLSFSRVNERTGNTTGKISFNAFREFETNDIKDLSFTLNSKYGKTDAADSLYGLVRTTAVHFSGTGLQEVSIEDSSDLEELGYANLFRLTTERDGLSGDPSPGGSYPGATIHDRRLQGADWSNTRFSDALIYKNDLSGANLTNAEFGYGVARIGTTTYYPSRLYQNNLSSARVEGMRYVILADVGN